MGTVVKVDLSKPGDAPARVEVPDDTLGQDTAAEHAAKMAAPKPKTFAERLSELEAAVADLQRGRP